MADTQETLYSEVSHPAEQSGGLPQFDATTFEPQLVWLLISFVLLYLIVSRMVLPGLNRVLSDREERIADDLDTAERLGGEAEAVRAAYEKTLTDARIEAQNLLQGAKDRARQQFEKAQGDLDEKLNAQAADAEKRIAKAQDSALAGLDDMARDVATAMVDHLAGLQVDEAAVTKAVTQARNKTEGA